MKTVLFVSHLSGLYGAERSLLDLLVALPDRVRPLVLLPSQGPLAAALADHGIEHHVLHYREWLTPNHHPVKMAYRAAVNAAALLRGLPGARRADMVYTNTLYSPLGGLLALALRLPHLWHVREWIHRDIGPSFDYGMGLSLTFVRRSADLLIYNSRALQEKYAPQLGGTASRVVYNGLLEPVDRATRFVPRGTLDADPIRLCILGSVQENKGQLDALLAVQALREQGCRAVLTIVGEGDASYATMLKARARELGLADQVVWAGFREDVQRVFRNSDIALVCSRFEAFGRVVVEAMSCGCPVVATATGGIPEIIDHEVNGLLYPAGDANALSGAILRLTQDAALYRRLSLEGASVYARFGKARYAREMVEAIDSCLQRPRQGVRVGEV